MNINADLARLLYLANSKKSDDRVNETLEHINTKIETMSMSGHCSTCMVFDTLSDVEAIDIERLLKEKGFYCNLSLSGNRPGSAIVKFSIGW